MTPDALPPDAPHVESAASGVALTPTTWWLVVDTASPRMSLALLRGHELQAQWGVRSLQPSAHRVVADIAYMLDRTGLRPTDLTALGALVGPGSFTGIRVGLAAVKGLAQPLNCPIATATTLEVLADAVAPLRQPTTVVVLNVSHRREVHGQAFSAGPDAEPRPLTAALTGEVQTVLEQLLHHVPHDRPLLLTGDGVSLLDDSNVSASIGSPPRVVAPPWLAPVAVPRLAARLTAGLTCDAKTLNACYARDALPTG
ncbi:tRNA (adenosine(37)-N6)-threonylcarbamoyltransferase complex dimerization subunit type 1 TsaB [Chloracidobacterium sp. MS 40/45]|jgi:tRNA threonylcarbamoyladenosine biosynthesis protein TsaB|uniref:tRNA (adenosine(37)-N6)-threonylcarbamoyltransferase complex dimerization subunit type 1 TsaB n=1 Tax=Chloracidobacterium aggregatum TaxID=2851959 RepID=UPI001B8AE274|nr:tRNA (adenosine(37)-N6)-threonylcarbamoyltransferase complex dimerization subunit type 1 TsaB [Chloracidobacterium aggregatum]QUV99801.1 tRNA (adenosine(37)-N6)-threonylcarbamoyltransferase complex dimerization subunit type 1 TsaB [Chloracidobacterium sp. MS 40/45]